MFVPGAGGSSAAVGVLLAVGALALLAGHAWGLLVLMPAHVALAGKLWPQVALAGTSDTPSVAALAVVLVTMVPTVALSAVAMPGIVATLLPERSPRARSLVVAAGALCLAAALIVPAVAVRAPRRAVQADRGVQVAGPAGEAVAVRPKR